MLRCVVRRCSIVICFFMMCPRRTTLSLPPIHKLDPGPYKNVARNKLLLSKFVGNIESIVKDSPVKGTKVDEAGFDLTSEEMVKFKIWPQGVIPYYIDVYSYSDKVLRDRIRGFLNSVSSVTSLNFLELPSPPEDHESRWVFFINRRGLLGCSDHSTKNFTNKGVQKVILGYDCMSTGGELAEAVLAIAGVPAQHNAPNRDKYIRVIDANITPDKKQFFTKLNNDEWLFHDIEYDFASAGHYHPHKYSQNGKATIEMQAKYQDISVGENNVLSPKDILKIKMLYNFIAKKKQNIPECHKLFAPGSKFDTYEPANVEIIPRRKPNLYMGISEDTNDIINNDMNSAQAPVKDGSKDVNTAEEVSHEEDDPIDNPNESKDDHSSEKAQSLKQQLSFKKDPISYLSDYKSSDDGKTQHKMQSKSQQLAFAKPGFRGKKAKAEKQSRVK